jgi:hypothetical protein
MTYTQWLALSEDERDRVHFNDWNVYQRQGYPIALMAAARLADTCGLEVYDIQIGTYHGGEYLLHMTVKDAECSSLPPLLEQRFEGFRVAWFPLSQMHVTTDAQAPLDGTWREINDDTDAEFTFDTSTTPPTVLGKCISDGEPLMVSRVMGNENALLFRTTVPSSGYTSDHVFTSVAPNLCRNSLTMTLEWKRI